MAVQQHLVDAADGPPDAGDRRDAQLPVDVGAAGIVDAGQDDRDPVRLLGGPRADDVAVVPGGDRDERVRVVDPGRFQHGPAEAVARVEGAGESRRQQPASLGLPVDEAYVVAFGDELRGECGTDPAAAHDDHSHRVSPFGNVLRRRSTHFRASSAASNSAPNAARTAQSAAASGAVLKIARSGGA